MTSTIRRFRAPEPCPATRRPTRRRRQSWQRVAHAAAVQAAGHHAGGRRGGGDQRQLLLERQRAQDQQRRHRGTPAAHEAPGGKASPYMKQQTEMATRPAPGRDPERRQRFADAARPDLRRRQASNARNQQLNELKAEVETMNKQLQQARQAAHAAAGPAATANRSSSNSSYSMTRSRRPCSARWAR